MPEYRRVLSKGGTYFFTVITYRRISIFIDELNVNNLKECFNDAMQNRPFTIETIVVLPDHIHTIWTLPDTDDDFSTRWMLIKKRFSIHYSDLNNLPISDSRRRKREHTVWQRRFWEHLIRDDEDFAKHCDYIHYNPVRHGLVTLPGQWKHSSFGQFVKKGYYPGNWGMNEPEKLHNLNFE